MGHSLWSWTVVLSSHTGVNHRGDQQTNPATCISSVSRSADFETHSHLYEGLFFLCRSSLQDWRHTLLLIASCSSKDFVPYSQRVKHVSPSLPDKFYDIDRRFGISSRQPTDTIALFGKAYFSIVCLLDNIRYTSCMCIFCVRSMCCRCSAQRCKVHASVISLFRFSSFSRQHLIGRCHLAFRGYDFVEMSWSIFVLICVSLEQFHDKSWWERTVVN